MKKALTELLRTACSPDNIDVFLKKSLEILSGTGAFGPKDGLAIIPGSDSGQAAVFRNFTKEEKLPLLSGKKPGAGQGLFLKVPLQPGRRKSGMLAARLTAVGAEPRAAAELLELAAQLVSSRLSHEKRDAGLNRERDLAAAIRNIQELYLACPGISLKELSRNVLDEARRLTGSLFGFAGYLDPETGRLNVPTLTDGAWNRKCRVKGRPFIFTEFNGLWGWVLKNKKPLMINCAASDPRASGLPQGHVKIDKFLAVPALYRGKLLGILALANPRAPYHAQDLGTAFEIARVYAALLHRAIEEARLAEESNKRLAIIASSRDIIYSAGPDGRFTYVSPRVKDYGYTPEELAGRSIFDFVHPDDLGPIKATFARAMKTGRAMPLVCCRLRKKNGSFFHTEQKSGTVMRGGRPVLITGVVRDVTWKRGAEIALKESEGKYRALFEASRDALMLIEAGTWKFTQANQETLKLFGQHDEASFVKLTPWSLSPKYQPDGKLSSAKAVRMLEQAFAKGSNSFEWLHKRNDGTPFPAEVLLTRVDMAGKSLLLAGVRDIAVRKKTEELLRQNERFLDSVVDNIPDMVFVKDAKDLRFVRLNKAAEILLGVSAKDLLGTSDHDNFPPKEAGFFRKMDRKVLAEKNLLDIPEEQIHTKAGEKLLHTKKIPILDNAGKPLYLLGISEDITERRRMEKLLIENEETLRQIFETSSDAITLKGMTGRYLKVNKAFSELFRVDRKNMLGRTPQEVFPPEMAADIKNDDNEVIKTGKTILMSKEWPTPSGKRYLSVARTPIRGANRKTIGILSVTRDITLIKKMETELAVARATEALSKVARPMAHDFNNALTAIMGYASLIDDELTADNPIKTEIMQIMKAVRRAAVLTSDFQDFARNPKLPDDEKAGPGGQR